MKLDTLGLQLESPLALSGALNFRPPSWPPPADWSPVIDAEGNAQCFYADASWPLDVWAGSPLKINFGDGKTKGRRISPENANILRLCATWFMWGPNGCRTASTFAHKFSAIKPLFVTCTNECIAATDLSRFPAVIDKVADSFGRSTFEFAITILHELLDASEHLGFTLLDKEGLARLSKRAPEFEFRQTPYIPPRIWSYQVRRLEECLEDYLKHQVQVEACFQYCLDAYAQNFGSLKQAMTSRKVDSRLSPFKAKKQNGYTYLGPFEQTADLFGVTKLIETWVEPFDRESGLPQLPKLSQYLDLVQKAGLAYLLSFSIMRIEEAWDLRSDCLILEVDEQLGDFHILRGETTKTVQDSDARWPVSSSVSLAIEVMKQVASLRMRCAQESGAIGLTPEDVANPYLISYQYEPWSRGKHMSYRTRPVPWDYHQVLRYFPLLLAPNQLTLTEEDLRIARLLTPDLNEQKFKVGQPWRMAWHQLRRTGAVNMLSSEVVDESSVQLLLKHRTRAMSLYYGRNHARLALNQKARALFLKTMYQEIARDLKKLSSPEFVSPLGEARKESIVTFIREADAVSLDKAAQQGKVAARRIRAGFCVNHLPCTYGGIESIAHCLGAMAERAAPISWWIPLEGKVSRSTRRLSKNSLKRSILVPLGIKAYKQKNARLKGSMTSAKPKTAEVNFREAFERLKHNVPKVLPLGTPVSQNNVSREAGCDESALKKKRFPALVEDIQAYVLSHEEHRKPSSRQHLLKQRQRTRDSKKISSDLKAQRDSLTSLLLDANAHIGTLTQKVRDLEARLEDLQPTARLLPLRSPKTSAAPRTMDIGSDN